MNTKIQTRIVIAATATLFLGLSLPAQEPPPAEPLPLDAAGALAAQPESGKGRGAESASTQPDSASPVPDESSKANAPTRPVAEDSGSTAPVKHDPVQVVSGSVVIDETDLVVPCPHLDLVLSRAYDSNMLTDGALGPRWTHSYAWELVRYQPAGGALGDWVCLRAKADPWLGPYNGAFHWFRRQPDGHYSVSPEAPYTLHSEVGGRWTLRLPGGVTCEFGADGVLERVAHPAGAAVELAYADRADPAARRLTRVQHSNGQFLAFAYHPDGLLASVATADPAVSVSYTYTALNTPHAFVSATTRLLSATTRRTPRGDISLSYRYDRWSEPSGPPPAIPAIIPPYSLLGLQAWNEPDPRRPIPSIPPHLSPESPGWRLPSPSPAARESVGGRLVERTDANGVSARYVYRRYSDATAARAVHTEMDGGLFTGTLEYHGGRTTSTSHRGDRALATDFHYDAQKRVTAIGDHAPDGLESQFIWSDSRDILRATTTDKATTRFLRADAGYGAYHNPTRLAAALDGEPADWWLLGWDPAWRLPATLTTPGGRVFRATYDAASGLPTRLRADGPGGAPLADTRVAYDDRGLPAAVTNANGRSAAFEHTPAGYLAAIVPEAGPRLDLRRNALGFADRATLPGPGGVPRVTDLQVDERGRPLHILHPDGATETFAYSGTGRPTLHIDAAGRTNRVEWLLGTPVLAERWHTESGQFARATIQHDLAMNTLAIRDALDRPVESYILDAADRVVAVTNLEGQALSVSYAVAGLPAAVIRFDGSTVSLAYDRAANPTNIAFSPLPSGQGGGAASYSVAYDPDGLPLAVADASGAVSNAYNEAGWLVSSSFHPAGGAPARTLALSRYPAGQVSNALSAAGADAYHLGPADRLETQTRTPLGGSQPAQSYAYSYHDWNGLPSAVTNSAGLSVGYGYDLMDRPTSIAWRAADGALLRGFEMRYNILGMITNVTQTGAGFQPVVRAYAYDSLDRLVAESGTGGPPVVRSYEYDLVGNRTQDTIDGAASTYTLGLGNRLASWGAAGENIYTHDAAGNVTRIARAGHPALDLAWDAQYRLATVSTNGVVLEAYGYDPLGRRAWTESPLPLGEGQGAAFARTTYAYDDNWQVVADLDATGAVLRSYIWGPGIDNLLALTDHTAATPAIYYALTDHLGTVHAFADSSGNIAESYTYDAWGNVLAVLDASGTPLPASALGNRYLFQGREYSWASQLYNFRARWYDPATGRWLSNDPIGISGGLNQYVFCGNKPVHFTDAFGLCTDDEGDGFWDLVHGGLDIGGMVEPTPFCDIINSLIYCGRGKWADAGLTILGVVPYIGDAGKVGKYGSKLLKHSDEVIDATQRLKKLSKAESSVWKALKQGKKGRKSMGKGNKKRYFEWDNTHGHIEVYDARGQHRGVMDAASGHMVGPPVPGRRIDL